MNGLGMYGTYRRGRRVWPSYDAYKAHRAQMAQEQRQRLADAQAERTAAADRRREEAEARAHESKLQQILDCDALWSINPRADDAMERIEAVDRRVRRWCMDMLPWNLDPICMTIRIQQRMNPRDTTLDTIAVPYGFTRQRVEQIVNGTIKSMGRNPKLRKLYEGLNEERAPSHWETMEEW